MVPAIPPAARIPTFIDYWARTTCTNAGKEAPPPCINLVKRMCLRLGDSCNGSRGSKRCTGHLKRPALY